MEEQTVKLQKFLKDGGIASRREAEQLIIEGKVLVNGIKAMLGQRVSSKDKVVFDGKTVTSTQKRYFLLYKPVGYTSSSEDIHAEKLVTELLPEQIPGVSIVGRLDKNSEGLMLLTNDGELAYRLTHPKFEVEKEYRVEIAGKLSDVEREKMIRGIRNREEQVTYYCKQVDILSDTAGRQVIKIILTEGKKREIRELLGILGKEVLRLTRVRFGPFSLESMNVGEVKEIPPPMARKNTRG